MRPEDLKVIPALRELSDRDLAALTGVMQRKKWADGQRIIQQGTPADGVYFLLRGHVRVERRLPGGRSVGLATMGPGALFGTMAALDGQRRAADCIAWGAVECACLAQPEFRDLVDGRSVLSLRVQTIVLRVLFRDLRATNTRLAELATLPTLDTAALEDAFTGLG